MPSSLTGAYLLRLITLATILAAAWATSTPVSASGRTLADPAIVRGGDAYCLVLTLADGYWRSPDLLHWQFTRA